MNPTFGGCPIAFQLLPFLSFPPSATKCHQFILARGPISSFTANIREMHFSSCYHLTVLISTTRGTQYCLHILLCGISTGAKISAWAREGDVYSLFYEIFSICGCLSGRKNSCKSKEHNKIAITTVEPGSKEHNSLQQKVEGFLLI